VRVGEKDDCSGDSVFADLNFVSQPVIIGEKSEENAKENEDYDDDEESEKNAEARA
jgi:hypothetical protein